MKTPVSMREMKIQELAARTGVSKSTIHYYTEKGLLPRPKKANRTIAYYDEGCVERIRLIRAFQEKAFLPLGRIKRLLDSVGDDGMLENILAVSAYFAGWLTNAAPVRPMSEADVIDEFGFTKERLDRLIRLGVLTPEVRRNSRVYHPEDVEILRILARMGERGFTAARGWPTEALSIYVDAAHQLAKKEVEQLFTRMVGGLDPHDAQILFKNTGEDLFLGLFLWMRRKAMRREFADRVKQMKKRA
jgi:DNA-binding transcriptional MerR regulator